MHLPPALARKLLALAICSVAVSPLTQANIVQKAWESGSQIAESEKTTLITVNSGYLEKPFSIKDVTYLTLSTGEIPTFHAGATHFNWQGELLDSSGSTIIDPETGLTLGLGTAVTTNKDIQYTWGGKTVTIKAGTVVLGTTLGGYGSVPSTTYARDFYAIDYDKFSSETSTTFYTDDYTNVDTFYMGKTNESWGSIDKEVSTTLIIGANNSGVNRILGANLITEDASSNADFYGTSTIILKEGSVQKWGSIIGALQVNEGAKFAGDFSGKVQISLQSSAATPDTIIGGSYNASNNASTFGHNGESSVEIYLRNDSSAGQIVGGNSGYAGSFKGDVNIEINGQAGSVIGAGHMQFSGDADFTGDTHIKYTTPATYVDDYLYGNLFSAEQGVIGGFASNTGVSYSVDGVPGVRPGNVSFPSVNFEGKTATITGKTQIELDFSSAPTSSDPQAFNQALVAGSLIGNGLTLTHTGSSELKITGAGGVQFSKWVVGGNVVSDTTDGNYYGYDGNPFPYYTRENMASASIDSVVVSVDSGDFSYIPLNDEYGTTPLFTVGSMSAGGGNVTTGSTQADISGGRFATLIGGNTSEIADQNFDGEYFKDTTSGATKVGNVTLNVSGDASTYMIVGGSYISDNVTAVTGIDPVSGTNGVHIVNAADVGDVTVKITGGAHRDITSGSYIGQHIAQSEAAGEGYLITQGNLSLSVTGNSHVAGQIIAGAGIINGVGTVRAETASTQIEIGSDVVLENAITITGGYMVNTSQITPSPSELYTFNYTLNKDKTIVTGNRQLVFNGKTNYANLANATFIEFDEVQTGAGTTVDFGQNKQDLDLLGGRHNIGADAIHVVDGDFTGTNTVRKTGEGTLILSAQNGQVNTEDNLQLVVEKGKVVLAANSSATTQTNFKTFAIHTGATLDMSAGSNTAGAAAGINGHLHLEGMSTVIADAGRSVSGMGTSMIDGKLTVDAKFMLSLTNMGNVQLGMSETFTLDNGTSLDLGLFNIVLFSNLSYTDPTNVIGIDFLEGMWYGEEAKIAIASDYMMSNFYLGDEDAIMETGDVFIVWRENGDMLLTSGIAFAIPEPSTATLSLMALAGLLARRRRKAV